jgi:hypothetical protein
MNIENNNDATRFLHLVVRYFSYTEKLMARAPKGTMIQDWDERERAAAERRVSEEVGLSLAQLETIKQWDLRAMAKRAFLLFEVPVDTTGFIHGAVPA